MNCKSVLSILFLCVPPFAGAQQYPAKPIRIVVGFAPGGPTDIYARLIGQKLTAAWGQPIIVDARPGASGNIGADIVAKSPPDGYTLMVPSFSIAVNPSLYLKLPYDLMRDFAPVSLYASVGHILLVHPSVPARNIAELLALAKKQPAGLLYASAGNGTAGHLAGELFNMMTGARLTHIPYKGMAPAQTDTIGGQVSMLFDSLSTGLTAIRAGRLRPIAVTTLNRQPSAPDIPTLSESGLTGYEVSAWYGLLAPAGTSRDIVQRLYTEVARGLREPDARERFTALGAELVDKNPEAFTEHLRSEIIKWGKVVKAAGMRVQ
ncbi:MAG TPA: tripartite tricarboxylate transporter substrate binding protein [Burkholderiales bacterium]|nr:tripartite tricarboxylate transporter substrate binding protein [Burkholderiales bacterium]